MRIAIVEDEAPIRNGLEKIIRKLGGGYEVAGKAADGVRGLALIKKEKPDLVIMDIKMPEMDGLTMLEKAREEGIECKAVVLSAYTDFTYAKTAMGLGVANYLLKPVRVHELEKALEQVEKELEEERRENILLSLENIIRSAQSGILEGTEETARILEDRFGVKEDEPAGVLVIWLGKYYDSYKEITGRILKEITDHAEDFRVVVTAFPEKKQYTMVVFGMKKQREWETYFEKAVLPMLLSNTDKKAVCSWELGEGIFGLDAVRKKAAQDLEWSLSLGNEKIISGKRIELTQVCPLQYPQELSMRVKQAVLKKDKKEFEACFHEFGKESVSQTHNPREIKEACITFTLAVLNTAREYVNFEKAGIETRVFMETIMKAYTWEEIGDCLKWLFSTIMQEALTEEHDSSPLVRKAKHMIEEYYSQGITMEEVARNLGVTPEYLSRQYKKETGWSFSEDIRNFKIEKVKVLLLGTDLNLTRIASMTGFSDPKYMSKVFKEAVGMLPGEYREMHH